MMERGRELKGIVIARRGGGGCLGLVLIWRGWGMACLLSLISLWMWYMASGCDGGVVCSDIAETLADMLVLKFSRTKDCLLVLRETSFTSIATILASGCADLDIDHHVVSLPFTRPTGQPDDIVEAQRIMHIASSFLCEKHRKRTWAAG